MHWCNSNLSLFVATQPVASDFLTLQGHVIPPWYRDFLFHTRAYVATNQAPILQLASRPDDSPESPDLTLTRGRIEVLQAAGYNLNEQQE
jgi:hypothetical protein